MKILYIGSERSDAETAATSLRGIAKNVAVSWAPRLDHAARWLEQNRDLAALIVEAQMVEAQINGAWPSVLKQVRGLALRPAVVVIVPEVAGSQFKALEPEADDYIAKNDSLGRDLPIVVTLAIARAQEHQQSKHALNVVGKTHERVEITSERPHDNGSRWQDMSAPTREVAGMMAVPACVAALPDAALRAVRAAHDALRQIPAESQTAPDWAGRAGTSEASTPAADRQAHQPNIHTQLADAMAAKSALERRLADSETSYRQREQLWSGERAAAVERQAQLDEVIELERAARADLEQNLAHATAALLDAEQRHRAAMAAAAEQLAERQAQYEIGMARAAATWDMVDEQLRAAALEVERARQNHASAAAAVDRLTLRESELSSRLAEAAAIHDTLERRLADTETAVEAANARTERERLAAAEQLGERQREHQAQIAEEIGKRRGIEDTLAQALNALDDAEKRHASAMGDASAQSRELEEALRLARQDLESKTADVERFTKREADLTSMLADATTSRNNLERRLAATEAAFQDADTRATRERLAASKRAAEREAELDGQIRQERATRAALEQAVADADAALRDAQHRHDAALAAAANELAERQAHFDRELSQTVADRDRITQRLAGAEGALDQVRRDHQSAVADVERLAQREADLTSQLADVAAARDTLERQLAEAVHEVADADERAAHDRAAATDRQADLEGRLAHEIATHDTLKQILAETRSAALEAERLYGEEADALRARALEQETHFEAQLTHQRLEHERRLAEMAERLHTEHRELRERVEQAQAAADAEIRRLTAERSETERTLEDARRDFQDTLDRLSSEYATALATLTAAVAERDKQLDESRAESHRLFQQVGLAMFRCTRDGALTQANRACMRLVGSRTFDELGGAHFAATVFEAPNDLSWLIERCVSTRAKETIETTWRRKDGGRLFLRLSACASAPGIIEIVAEDLTRLRVLQERLGRAHRMEAAGRLASEVAVTCSNMLSDVHANTQAWLKEAGGNAASRRQGEMLLDEVARAAALLRQLAAYGDDQARTPTLVDLNTVIRDLEPVLKRVAGDDVEVQLPDTSSQLHVDVGTERVERLLVNLASYGRERMPFGGQLKIELGTIVVDRHFAAKHPSVRLGLHGLITVTVIRRGARADGRLQHHDDTTADNPYGNAPQKPGVDFGALQGLVSGCGGHLWMTVQPLGDMVAKIRLPLLTSYDQTHRRTLAARAGRERTITRWFQR